jgi:hypothetical protein
MAQKFTEKFSRVLEQLAKAKGYNSADVGKIHAMIEMVWAMCSKVVINYIEDFVKNKPHADQELAKGILAKLETVERHTTVGYADLEANTIANKIRIHLMIVPKDYEFDFYLDPALYVVDDNETETKKRHFELMQFLFKNIDNLIDSVVRYYSAVMTCHSDLATMMKEFTRSSTADKFSIHGHKRTMFLDENYAHRIGVAIYYVDGTGKRVDGVRPTIGQLYGSQVKQVEKH